jgi:hypothetical protein
MRAKGLPHFGEIFSNISLEFGHRDDIRFLEARARVADNRQHGVGAQRATSPEEQAALFSKLYNVLYDASFLHVLPADCKLINFCYPLRDGVHHVVPIDPDAYLRCTQCDSRHIARMGIVALFTAYVSARPKLDWFFDKLLALVRELYGEAYSAYAAAKAGALPSASCEDRAKSGTLLAPIVAFHSEALAELMHRDVDAGDVFAASPPPTLHRVEQGQREHRCCHRDGLTPQRGGEGQRAHRPHHTEGQQMRRQRRWVRQQVHRSGVAVL